MQEEKERKKIGTQTLTNVFLFVVVTLCDMAANMHASACPDPVSLFTRPSPAVPDRINIPSVAYLASSASLNGTMTPASALPFLF